MELRHISDEEMDAYVVDGDDCGNLLEIEMHVENCSTCSRVMVRAIRSSIRERQDCSLVSC